ncbi:carbohydrate kinase [Microbulbifer sp. TYP-18]|uniref:carbohydrate kinase n=1 Tax=Microbulbifer sp. TYP-18 TaxID=3230024 RepID=UPI0034C66A25
MKVVCFGEALVDMLSNRVSGEAAFDKPEQFSKFAGGAPANAAVAVAKLGGEAYFAGMLGDDLFGHFLYEELQSQGVHTDYLRFTKKARTALAFVSLDAGGERSFEFYRPPAADLLFCPEDFAPGTFVGQGILHVCSNSLTEEAIAATTVAAVSCARRAGWLVSFDANLRHNLWSGGEADRDRVNALLALADLVKLSREELEYLACDQSNYLSQQLQHHQPQLILVSDGAKPVQWTTKMGTGQVEAPAVVAVDTTAGGDAFIGGFIHQLALQGVTSDSLPKWLALGKHRDALVFACACGAHTVSRQGAFAALPTLENLNIFLEQR